MRPGDLSRRPVTDRLGTDLLLHDRVRGVDDHEATPLAPTDPFDQHPPSAVDAPEAATAGEDGDGATAAIADGDLERRRTGPGHHLQALDLTAYQDRSSNRGFPDAGDAEVGRAV